MANIHNRDAGPVRHFGYYGWNLNPLPGANDGILLGEKSEPFPLDRFFTERLDGRQFSLR
jgi:hypothetical protein